MDDLIIFGGKGSRFGRFWDEDVYLEGLWTFAPLVILLSIAVPSLALLYSIEEIFEPIVSIKVIGNQWYWSYEFSDYNYLDTPKSPILTLPFASNSKLSSLISLCTMSLEWWM